MDRDDLISIAHEIDHTMRKWIEENPDKLNQPQLLEKHVMKEMLIKFEGVINPIMIDCLINLHKKPMKEKDMAVKL